jgi:acylphosphatase
MTKQKVCMHCFVSGKVQGVWFRASTQTQANQIGVTGWVRNLSDGRVEVIVCGQQAKVEALCEWLKKGPQGARVSEFFCEEMPVSEYQGFEVL